MKTNRSKNLVISSNTGPKWNSSNFLSAHICSFHSISLSVSDVTIHPVVSIKERIFFWNSPSLGHPYLTTQPSKGLLLSISISNTLKPPPRPLWLLAAYCSSLLIALHTSTVFQAPKSGIWSVCTSLAWHSAWHIVLQLVNEWMNLGIFLYRLFTKVISKADLIVLLRTCKSVGVSSLLLG